MALNGVDLNLLPALDALLAERNVTRAAERMSLGQPAMSAVLARLRKHFGDPLLVRDGRGLVLTTLAASLVGPVREAVAATEAVLGERPPFDPRTDARTFTLVGSDYIALVLLRPLIAELAEEAPEVRINVVAVGSEMEDRLRRGSADLLVYPVELAERFVDLPRTTLFEDRFVLAADRDNPDIVGGVDLSRFCDLPYLAVSTPFPSLVETQLDALGVVRRTEFTTEAFVTAPLLLTGTRLVGLFQERLVQMVREQANLTILPAPMELRPMVEAMYWNPRNTDDAGHRWLRERLVAQAARLDSGLIEQASTHDGRRTDQFV